jgi:hypothetical protein
MYTMEEAVAKARELLARGWVLGVSRNGDPVGGTPAPERVTELAGMIMSGAVDADARLADVQ